MGNQRRLVPETIVANRTCVRFFAGMLPVMALEMDGCLERFSTFRTLKVPDVIVMCPDVSFEAGGFAEALVAIFAPDLATDSVSAKVVSQGISVRVLLIADIALEVVAFVRGFVNACRCPVIKLGRTPVT